MPPIPDSGRLRFNVVRHGNVIGTHLLNFEGSRDRLSVRVDVRLRVGLGPITLFRYHHQAWETWEDGRFSSIETETDNDGEPLRVTVRRTSCGLEVDGTNIPRYIAPDEALPATHWNRRMLDGPFINTQDGKLMHPKVTELGLEQIPTATGGVIHADRFALSGEAALDTWYDENKIWAGVRFKAGDQSEIRYVRV